MQDKYNIGPVTIVQLVGLSAKPRIASVQTDVAARAADPIPMSAAAGFGDDVSRPVADLDIRLNCRRQRRQWGCRPTLPVVTYQ